MITIRLCGGLGNQLFQLALGLSLGAKGRNVEFDMTLLDHDPARRYLLGDFGLKLKLTNENKPVTVQEKSLCFDPSILELTGNQVLQGYWQNENYFIEHENYIRGMLFRQMQMSPQTLAIAQKIKECGERSCFVHMRRSDNLRPSSTLYHGLTDTNDPYFGRAISKINEGVFELGQSDMKTGKTSKAQTPHFFIFSDDVDYLESRVQSGLVELTKVVINAPSFTEDETHNLHKTDAGREVEDLWLMSLCRHAIIANSTFSWWGAWLNWNENLSERIVTAPEPWYSSDEAGPTEILPERWKKIPR